MKFLLFICRVLTGAVFMFSGFVKAVDPLGSCYKFTDYFNLAFNLPWLAPLSLPLAFILASLEFTTGVMLLFKLKARVGAWFALAFMIIFTPLTLYLAIENPVHDCGCFGDALVLSNWETFAKNLVLLVFVLFVFIKRKQLDNPLSDNVETAISITVFVIGLFFQLLMIRHLPIFDFRPYKIGNNIAQLMEYPADAQRPEYDVKLIYKNKQTGENETFALEDYQTYGDTAVWEFVDQKSVLVKEGYVPPIHDFTMTDTLGVDHAQEYLNAEKPVLMVIVHKIEKANEDGLEMLKDLQEYADKKDWEIIALTSSNIDVIEETKRKYSAIFPFYQTDDITLKTIVRANPGLVLMEKGTVMDKWNFRDFKFK